MLISYQNNLLLDLNTSDVSEDLMMPKPKERFTVTDIAVDKSNSTYFAKVEGDIVLFTNMNPTIHSITNIPYSDSIMYFANPDYGTPKSVQEHYKFRVRELINDQVGDTYDIMADLARKITMTERLCVSLAEELFINNITPDTKLKYSGLIEAYKQYLIAYNGKMDVADLDDPVEVFNKLLNRSISITNLVESEYKNKLNN